MDVKLFMLLFVYEIFIFVLFFLSFIYLSAIYMSVNRRQTLHVAIYFYNTYLFIWSIHLCLFIDFLLIYLFIYLIINVCLFISVLI